ncbi:MAG: GTPase Der [Bryobacteraceae bacterium]|nr:MAG: GTPase Der [Bryobacteraceae bacterium]
MPESTGLPTVVIVGRPNVGKSTLFNAILGQRKAITGDEPGITRDRIAGEAVHRRRRFRLIDTGGIIPDDEALIPSEILRQARVALDEAAHIIFLIDGRTEITAADRDLAMMLRRLGKPVTLAVNKIDAPKREVLAAEFYSLGFERVIPVSAEHRLGLSELLDEATRGFPQMDEEAEEEEKPRAIRVAIIGRPNVGKSTLLNALLGQERAIVSPIAGTTRDSVDERMVIDGREYVFVDTAGIRRKGKTKLMAEKLSVVMARRHIRMAHIALLVLDASEGPVGGDATIGGYAHEEGRALVLVVNKWDLLSGRQRKEYEAAIRAQFKFLDYAPIVFLSAKEKRGLEALLEKIDRCWESFNQRVPTGELNRLAEQFQLERGRRIYYITQPSVRPPTFVLFMDSAEPLHFSTERQIVNRLRERFGFEGTPVVLKIKARR